MFHFNYTEKKVILTEENDTKDSHSYHLILPTDVEVTEKLTIWLGIQITHWSNTIGKKATFKEVVKRFEQYCKEAEKLKI